MSTRNDRAYTTMGVSTQTSREPREEMANTRYTISVQVPAKPRVVFFATRRPVGFDKELLEDVTARVVRLIIEPVKGDKDGVCLLRRLDRVGETVWKTRHPSLQETFWHAEFEYEVKQDQWEKMK
jgi:hypothetical protein